MNHLSRLVIACGLFGMTSATGSAEPVTPLLLPSAASNATPIRTTQLGEPVPFGSIGSEEPLYAPPSFETVPQRTPQPTWQQAPSSAFNPSYRSQPLPPASAYPPVTSYRPVSPIGIEPGAIVCDASHPHGLPLYPQVLVRDRKNIHPYAVPKIVAVPDPCGGPNCVFVEICVPPCACEDVSCRRGKIRYDYGKYAVDIRQRRRLIVIDYDD